MQHDDSVFEIGPQVGPDPGPEPGPAPGGTPAPEPGPAPGPQPGSSPTASADQGDMAVNAATITPTGGRSWQDMPDRLPATDVNVEEGDTLAQLAQKHGVDVQELIRNNPQFSDPNKIYPGQAVHLPERDNPDKAFFKGIQGTMDDMHQGGQYQPDSI